MKKFIIIMLLAGLALPLAAQQEGIKFEELTYPEALAKAKQEKKLLFVDCYTTWCAPCKHMSANVFTLKEAGDYFASRLVAVKYDMERGEGLELAKQFGVKAYPTFLLVRPDGTVAHRIVGSNEWPEFVKILERGMNPKTSLAYLEEKCKQGKLDNKGLLAYKQALEDAYLQDAARKIADELLEKMTDKERLQADSWTLLCDAKTSPFASDNYAFIMANREKLNKNIGREMVDEYFYKTWSAFLSSINYIGYSRDAVTNLPPEDAVEKLQQLKQQIAGMEVNRKDFLLARCDAAGAVLQKDKQGVMQAIEAALPFLPPNDDGSILSALSARGVEQASAAELADIYGRYLEALPEGPHPEWVTHNWMIYRKQAHVGVYFEPLSVAGAFEWGEKRWQSPVYIWCYPAGDAACQEMEKSVFPREDVKNALRAVCVKYDLNSPEGKQLREQHAISPSSTHLLFNSDGTEIARLTGTPDPDTLIAWLEKFLSRPGR